MKNTNVGNNKPSRRQSINVLPSSSTSDTEPFRKNTNTAYFQNGLRWRIIISKIPEVNDTINLFQKIKDNWKKIGKGKELSWENMKEIFLDDLFLKKDQNKTIFEIFKKFSSNRKEIIKSILKLICNDCSVSLNGSNNIGSDADATIYKLVTFPEHHGKNDQARDYYIPYNAIKQLSHIMSTIDTNNLFINKSRDAFINVMMDINLYVHTFFYEAPIPLCTKILNDGMTKYIYVINEKINYLEYKNRHQRDYVCVKLIKEFNKMDTKMMKDLFDKINQSISIDKKSLLKEIPYSLLGYTEKLRELDRFIFKNRNEVLHKDNVIYSTINMISSIDFYSKESYTSYGALMHIVFGRQLNFNYQLPKVFYLHSAMENFAFIMHQLGSNSIKDPLQKLLKASKYLSRFYDAANLYYNLKFYWDKFCVFSIIQLYYRHTYQNYHMNNGFGIELSKLIQGVYQVKSLNQVVDKVYGDFKYLYNEMESFYQPKDDYCSKIQLGDITVRNMKIEMYSKIKTDVETAARDAICEVVAQKDVLFKEADRNLDKIVWLKKEKLLLKIREWFTSSQRIGKMKAIYIPEYLQILGIDPNDEGDKWIKKLCLYGNKIKS